MIGTILGRYRIDALLGEGGMGQVYRAFDTTLGRPAAVKVLRENLSGERLHRFMREARTASSLNHPNVVTIYEIGELDSTGHFIAMELVEGETLREALSRGRIELARALEWVAQIADGIATAHGAGITHRDLKPENIVIARTGFAKILDFGLAKLREEPPDPDAGADTETAVMATTPGLVLGTVGYMAPEQATGSAVDHRSDLFAIGCILYECITGRRPFTGESQIDTLHKIIYGEPAPIEERAPDTPRELHRIVRKLLAKDPEQRYQSAKDLALDLREVKSELGSQSRAAVARRKSMWPIALAAIALVIAAITIILLRRSPEPSPPRTAAPAKSTSLTRVTTTGNVLGSAISPDGEYIVYAHDDAGRQSIWLRQLASGSAIQIVPPTDHGIWGLKFSPDSRAIYYGIKSNGNPDGAIYQLPILGGTPRKILSNIESAVTFSPDGKLLAVHRIHTPKQGDSAIVIANVDGSGERTLITKSPPEHFAPSFWGAPEWSPDGKTIASPMRVDREWKLIGVDVATGAVRPLSNDTWRQVTSAAWLRDGIVVVGQPGQVGSAQLWRIAADGSRRRITNDLYEYRTVTGTADGKSLLAVAAEMRTAVWHTAPVPGAPARKMTTGRSEGQGGVAVGDDGTIFYSATEANSIDIFRLEPGGAPRRLTGGDWDNSVPSLTPDGRYIVFGMFREREAILARVDARDGSGLRQLCAIEPGGRNAQRIAITRDSRWAIFVSFRGGVERLWKVSIDGGEPVRVTDFEANHPSISPDDKRIAFSGGFIGVAPLAVDGVGGKPQRVPNTQAFSTSMAHWMPDGKTLLHSAGQNDRANLWLQPLDGSPPRKITNFDTEHIWRFDLSPNGQHLAIVRGLFERDAVLITDF